MELILLLFAWGLRYSNGVRLSPLENNDKLQDISNQYVAEWQWESWPIKQEPTEKELRSPGPRLNVALWKDATGPTWYLFGGQPVNGESKKIYSDVWRYSVTTRVWERFFPSQTETKGKSSVKMGSMMTLRVNLFDDGHSLNKKFQNYNVVLCGGITKSTNNTTKAKNTSLYSYTRRKKFEIEKKEEEPKSLAVYAPKTSKSNTVWQIDLKDKLWTAYVCCCDTTNGKKENSTSKSARPVWGINSTKSETTRKINKITGSKGEEFFTIDSEINKAEDEVDNEQEHLSISNIKNKKKINQTKKGKENGKKVEKRDLNNKNNTEDNTSENKNLKNKTKESSESKSNKKSQLTAKNENFTGSTAAVVATTTTTITVTNKEIVEMNKTKQMLTTKSLSSSTERPEGMEKAKSSSKYCPEFPEDGKPVTWCDGYNELLITADISSPQIVLWIFNLKTSHWSQQEVNVPNDIEWPGCSTSDSVRYAGNEEEVYIICSPVRIPSNTTSVSAKDSQIPSENSHTSKVVYRINYKNCNLTSLGEIQLRPFFTSPEGLDIWLNDTKSLLQIVKTPEKNTVLLFAYLDSIDLWVLNKNFQGKEYFDSAEKIWRGSALKWFNKYNAALYNIQFVSDSGDSETLLVPNPRMLAPNEYWPRERGRFIIRIFRNENLKNQTFENRTREQNLTYELLQSNAGNSESQLHAYSLKVLVFFGISLAIFTLFGFALFLKKCVNCPPKIRVRNECHKSPLVIRYSVIPDDLLYPVA